MSQSQLSLQIGGQRSLTSLIKGLVDPAVIILSLFFSHWILDQSIDGKVVLVGLLAFSILYPGTLPFRRRQMGLVGDIISQWLFAAGALLLLGWSTNSLQYFDTEALVLWFWLAPAAVWGGHLLSPWLAPYILSAQAVRAAVVVGCNDLSQRLVRTLNDDPLSGVRVNAFFDDRNRERIGDTMGLPLAGNLASVADYVKRNPVDLIYIAMPMSSQPRILGLLDDLKDTTCSLYFVPDIFVFDLIQARVDTIGGIPVVGVCETPFDGTEGIVKRWFDVITAASALVLLAPLLLFIAVIIKVTSAGPVIFKQRRYGLDGQEITVWKFRSMRVLEDGAEVKQATKDDDRITPIGRFIRKTSIDELPQLVNVLTGAMSIVGPRPHAVAHNESYRKLIKGYMMRHKVRPGITGWAQVNGARGETATLEKMAQRIDLDLYYLRHWSLRLDLMIVLRTVRLIFRDPNAY
jgi:putative colanic acid biosysnthesis UDP-glucose lipid carrier transferase